MKIRPATPDDIPAMMVLERQAATAAKWSRQEYDQLFAAGPRRVALVIEGETGVQGFLAARGIGSEWEVENIVIAEPVRRLGLGNRLLGEFLQQARAEGAQSVFLEVRESNQAARTLYERWAFVQSGRRPRYYHNPEEDAVVYRLFFV